jgi:dTDP-4-amino-4,6-dideoxygalactose transaminase
MKTNISLPASQYVAEQGLILPTFTELTNDQIDFISETVLKQL